MFGVGLFPMQSGGSLIFFSSPLVVGNFALIRNFVYALEAGINSFCGLRWACSLKN